MTVPAFLMLLFGKVPRIGGTPKPEDAICLDFAARLRKLTLQERLLCVWCHVPNEFSGKVAHHYGALKTSMGRVKGAADYWFISEIESFVIEVKQPGKKQSEFQIAFQFWCESVNVRYYLVESADAAMEILDQKGMIKLHS